MLRAYRGARILVGYLPEVPRIEVKYMYLEGADPSITKKKYLGTCSISSNCSCDYPDIVPVPA
eukprot:SAG31_NODE_578_length_13949_cov_5.041372_1_plen_63_part_00